MPSATKGRAAKARRLILHVGLPKCGSTFLQVALQRNADSLRQQGVSWPLAGDGHPGNAARISRLAAEGVDALFGEAATLVLSHEDLVAQAPHHARLAAVLHDMKVRVRVVAFLRPFSEFVFGDYSQNMKQGFQTFLAERRAYGGLDFEGFAAQRAETFDPAANLAGWAELFPRHPPVLAPHGSIPRTMARLLPGVVIDWNVPRDLTNPSLRICDCDDLAAQLADPGISAVSLQRRLLRAWLRAQKGASHQPDPGRSPERVALVEALFERQNAALLQRFGYDNRHPVAASRSGATAV